MPLCSPRATDGCGVRAEGRRSMKAPRKAANRETVERAMAEYARALEGFEVAELLWDLGCNILSHLRAAILKEFRRRKVDVNEAMRTVARKCREADHGPGHVR